MCKHGQMQSPIDLLNERVKIVSHLGRINRSYKPSNATLKNRGHDIMLKWADGAGSIVINGTQYVLKQLHWHSPSEHTLNGRRFNLELHMVHESPTGQAAVIGIMYKIGRPDSFLSLITDHLAAITDTAEQEKVVGIINPKQINIGSRKYYRYIGSLTTPPCTQNVVWTIVKKVRTVTREQVRLLRVAVHDESNTNARPLQPLNNRTVQLYIPDDPKEN
ncbi:Alpha carbonic anhydrase [Quillaja saponaria]|uniref:Carbonic anhydrase n=1 Tax=Quillaja saponaria TaxID=32244 RepID=A0AAD7VMI9_QUISA|nr:Alpha carbonic anhydrase [Quillaja saponaria]